MKVVGITGTSGVGKTRASQILQRKSDIYVIDCDKIAKDLSKPGNMYLNEIKNKFGADFLLDDGNLNRKKLAETIYENDEKLKCLNEITFKYVVDKILNEIETIKENSNINIVIIDAPLLFESNLDSKCDYVISMIADKNIKIKRICERDNITPEMAEKRLNIQKEDSFYTEKSDFVIENNGDINLEIQLEKIIKQIEG